MTYNSTSFPQQFQIDHLLVQVYSNRRQMGLAAAEAAGKEIGMLLKERPYIRMIFAAAPSQNEFLAALKEIPAIDWMRVTGFHMDEYLGLPASAPQGFGNFLRKQLFQKVDFQAVHYIDPAPGDPQGECRRYDGLLREAPIDIICMGVGENGHIAFNDPPVADFNDPEMVKIVELDETCRQQQVNDGCFASIGEVPHHAITLTVPALMSGRSIFCVVPGTAKAEAIAAMLKGPIAESCPASILRWHPQAQLFLDIDSAMYLEEPGSGSYPGRLRR